MGKLTKTRRNLWNLQSRGVLRSWLYIYIGLLVLTNIWWYQWVNNGGDIFATFCKSKTNLRLVIWFKKAIPSSLLPDCPCLLLSWWLSSLLFFPFPAMVISFLLLQPTASPPGVIFSSRRHLAMTGDTFSWHNWGCKEDATWLGWVETRNNGTYPPVLQRILKESTLKIDGATIEKPWFWGFGVLYLSRFLTTASCPASFFSFSISSSELLFSTPATSSFHRLPFLFST